MDDFFHSGCEVAVNDGFVYLPLLIDPDIEQEVGAGDGFRFRSLRNLAQKNEQRENLIVESGKHYVKSMSLQSLASSYRTLEPNWFSNRREEKLREYNTDPILSNLGMSNELETIVFKVMPFFIRKNEGINRRRLTEQEIIECVKERMDVPAEFEDRANSFLDTRTIEETLRRVNSGDINVQPLRNGFYSSDQIQTWVNNALDVQILTEASQDLSEALDRRKEFIDKNKQYIAALLYLKDQTSFEIDDFGFNQTRNGYLAYVKTPDYALKHWDGDVYMFKGCKIAVYANSPSHPFVIDNYSHPFLDDYSSSNQRICIRDNNIHSNGTAENIIEGIQTGVNTILAGYINQHGFNGYHKLSSDFFDGHRTSRNNKRIASGEVEITNDFVVW